MDAKNLEALRYPIGKFNAPARITAADLKNWIAVLEALPSRLQELVQKLEDHQLDTPYRPGGWTIRQVVHHLADSHHNSYIRFKWGLTEDNPTIKPYLEKEWAQLFDTKTAPIALSLDHLKAVHAKLVYLLKGLSAAQLQRTFTHPEGQVKTSLAENIGRYAWHSNHHYAHIQNLLAAKGW